MPGPPWVDDPSVPPDAILWRGVPPEHQRGLTEPPIEAAFRTGQASMYIREETSLDAMRARGPRWRLWCLKAADIRSFGCIIVREADDEGNRSHVLVLRADEPGKRLSGKMAGKMRANGHWEAEEPVAPVVSIR